MRAVEFPVPVKGRFRPHYMNWSEQELIISHAPAYLRNVIQIITETGLRVYKELAPMRKGQLDLVNRVLFIPDSKTPTGVAEVPLTDTEAKAVANQLQLARTRKKSKRSLSGGKVEAVDGGAASRLRSSQSTPLGTSLRGRQWAR